MVTKDSFLADYEKERRRYLQAIKRLGTEGLVVPIKLKTPTTRQMSSHKTSEILSLTRQMQAQTVDVMRAVAVHYWDVDKVVPFSQRKAQANAPKPQAPLSYEEQVAQLRQQYEDEYAGFSPEEVARIKELQTKINATYNSDTSQSDDIIDTIRRDFEDKYKGFTPEEKARVQQLEAIVNDPHYYDKEKKSTAVLSPEDKKYAEEFPDEFEKWMNGETDKGKYKHFSSYMKHKIEHWDYYQNNSYYTNKDKEFRKSRRKKDREDRERVTADEAYRLYFSEGNQIYNQIMSMIGDVDTNHHKAAWHLMTVLNAQISTYGRDKVMQSMAQAPQDAIEDAEVALRYNPGDNRHDSAVIALQELITGEVMSADEAKDLETTLEDDAYTDFTE